LRIETEEQIRKIDLPAFDRQTRGCSRRTTEAELIVDDQKVAVVVDRAAGDAEITDLDRRLIDFNRIAVIDGGIVVRPGRAWRAPIAQF
jgi:hypothetical protein